MADAGLFSQSRAGSATRLVISAAIAHPLFAQVLFVQARFPQFPTSSFGTIIQAMMTTARLNSDPAGPYVDCLRES